MNWSMYFTMLESLVKLRKFYVVSQLPATSGI